MRKFWGAWKLVPKDLKRELWDLVLEIGAFIAIIILGSMLLKRIEGWMGNYSHLFIWGLNVTLLLAIATRELQNRKRGYPNKFDIPRKV